MKKINVIVGLLFAISPLCGKAEKIELYVSPIGKEVGVGSKSQPFGKVEQAVGYLKDLRSQGNQEPVHIRLAPGKYELDGTIRLNAQHNSSSAGWVIFEGTGQVKIVGGKHITGWKQVAGNHWMVSLPEVKSGKWFFRQLFGGEKRMMRARTPNEGFLLTKGPLSKYAKEVGKYTWNAKQKEENPAAYWETRCGFAYRDNDFKNWEDGKSAEVLTYHSWESSWQSPLAIDTERKDVFFCSPCRYPIGTFGNAMRYRIENIREAMDMPGEWYLDREKGELHYLAQEGEDPNRMAIHAPYLSELLVCEGSQEQPVANVEFRNIAFNYADYRMGIYDTAPDWPREIQAGIPYFPNELRGGYTDAQAAPLCGQAIDFKYATNIKMEQCLINHVGAIAVRIAEGSSRVVLNGCEMYDVGGGGVYIGFPVRDVIAEQVPKEVAPHSNVVSNCLIQEVGLVHPAAVGVWLAQTYNNRIAHNELAYISNSGVSIGWSWGKEINYTKDNYIGRNYIHHVAQFMGDAAGIYSLGDCSGSSYEGNYLDQIFKGAGVHGVVDGMGFDGSSYHILIKDNIVGRISGKVASFAREGGPQYHQWEGNNFDLQVERPVLDHQAYLDPAEFTAYAEFNPVSSFLNLEGWLEQKWVFSKNGSSDKDGFYGILVQGKQVVGYLNIGGGKENLYVIESANDVLQDDQMNQVALSYAGGKMSLYFNNRLIGEKVINKTRNAGTGKLAIAPISANSLRNGIDYFAIKNSGFDLDNLSKIKNNNDFEWSALKKEIKVNEKRIIRQAGPQKKYYRNFISVNQ